MLEFWISYIIIGIVFWFGTFIYWVKSQNVYLDYIDFSDFCIWFALSSWGGIFWPIVIVILILRKVMMVLYTKLVLDKRGK